MIQIGTAKSIGKAESSGIVPDDRQELVQTVDYAAGSFVASVTAIDNGRAALGDKLTFSGVTFDATNWAAVESVWINRMLVAVVDDAGITYANCRVRVTGYRRTRFTGKTTADLEVWQV